MVAINRMSGYSLNNLKTPHACADPKPEHGFPSVNVIFVFIFLCER
jgi:hypothetical protein